MMRPHTDYDPDFRRWIARARPGSPLLRYRLPRADNADAYRAALERVEASLSEIRQFEALWADYAEARDWWLFRREDT